LWRWGAQAEIYVGEAPGVTTEENEEIRRLSEDVPILKAATTFFVGEPDARNG
jgi:transposase